MKFAHSATGSRTAEKWRLASSKTKPTTGPGRGSDKPRESTSPIDWNTSNQAMPRKPSIVFCPSFIVSARVR